MNVKNTFAACLFTVLGAAALPAMADNQAASQTYTYGTQLDIDKVLSITEDSGQACGVVNAEMVYLDSMGHKRSLSYSKLGGSCTDS